MLFKADLKAIKEMLKSSDISFVCFDKDIHENLGNGNDLRSKF